ncbi:hypothetical protein [Nocardia gipuzkoensis]|uniref:hypothetical protein n=1 Tax=Nocardia gipuzkoensis TaxID=2749991 RepID=UPI0015EEDB65|nr:hypothetical protein [Nocardia gipuzkoensis]
MPTSGLEDPDFHDLVSDSERRAIRPVFWSDTNQGRFRLDMSTRLDPTHERAAG